MNFIEALEKVRQLTEKDLQHKSMSDIVLSAAEEFGEFARELKIEDGVFGNSHKNAGKDGTVGEAIDMVIMALALYYARYEKVTGNSPEMATAEIPDRMMAKLNKWDKNQQREFSEFPDGEIGLYLLGAENFETAIPVITDRPKNIRSDVGSEDHGGMPSDIFAEVCNNGQIKQIKNKKDLPKALWHVYPYQGGTFNRFAVVDICCIEICKQMDENGIVRGIK